MAARAGHSGPNAPYRNPVYAAQLEELLKAFWPNQFSQAEADIPRSALGNRVRSGVTRARMASGPLPGLKEMGIVSFDWTSTGLDFGWKIRRADTKWLHITGDPGGFSGSWASPDIQKIKWVQWPAGNVFVPPESWELQYFAPNAPMAGGWTQVIPDVTQCAPTSQLQECNEPNRSTFDEALTKFGPGAPLPGQINRTDCVSYTVDCLARYQSIAAMQKRVTFDRFEDFTGAPHQRVDADTSWAAPFDIEGGRLVLDDPAEEKAEEWVNHVLDSSYPDPLVSAPSGQTRGGPGGTLGVNPTRLEAEPVNTATGSYSTTAADLALPGIGIPFVLRRSYNSTDTTAGPLGVGWTHSCAASLTVQANGDVVAEGPDGQRLAFTRQVDGSFVSDAGGRSTLTKLADGYELVRNDQVRLRFDTQGRLTSLVDRNGRGLTLSYGADGRLATVTDGAGRSITFTYNADGLLTGVSVPDGRSVSYAYASGRLTSVVDVLGGTTSYTYDASARLASITDPKGRTVVQNTYGADGRVVEQLDARGNRSTFAWDAATQTSTFTDARGDAWRDVYANNVLLRRVDPLGNTTTFTHDTDLNVTSVSDPRGNATTMTYDRRGNLLTLTAPAPLSYRQSFTYDGQNNVASSTDGRGNTTAFGYDAAGNLTSVTEPGNVVTQYGRDPAGTGLLVSLTDPRGKITRFEYDGSGNLTKVTSPLGAVTTMAYDAAGRMTSFVEPRGNVAGANPADYRTTFTYDAARRKLTETDPLGNVTRWAYDPVGNLTGLTDAKNRTTSYAYNATDQLISVTSPDNTATSYSYDPVGNLISRTDAKNRTTQYGYDAANRLTSVVTPANQRWSYQYDANGNLTRVVDANGNATADPADGTTSYGYDVLNRLVLVDYSDATPDVQYGYDANGNRTSMTDGLGTESYVYDALDRLTSVTRGTDTFAYAYDAAGNITRRTYPDASVADYSHDDDGRLATVASGGQTTAYAYDVASNLTQTTLPAGNGYVEKRSYDRARRLTSVESVKGRTTLAGFSYTLDAVGSPTAVSGTSTGSYKYDSLERLTEVCFKASCTKANDPYIRYAYDAVGNRTSETQPSGTTTYAYDDADRLTSKTVGGVVSTYGYDVNGNLTRVPDGTYTYDLANRVKTATVGELPQTVSYDYDGDGQRLRSRLSEVTGEKEYLWDVSFAVPELAIEREGGSQVRRYLQGHRLVSMTNTSATFYYHYDAIGSVVNLTSSSGATQWTYSYEPFGKLRSRVANAPGAPENLLLFGGELFDEENDSEMDLYHLRARQYDPGTGRFLRPDPLAPPLTDPYVSSYVYVKNRPTFMVDPSGLQSCAALISRSCVIAWIREDPFNNVVWPLAEAAASGAACAEGATVGAVAGPYGSVIGCVTVATAFVISAETAKQQIEDLGADDPPISGPLRK